MVVNEDVLDSVGPEHDVNGMEYPFGQLGSAVPAVSPPNFLCTPSLLAGGVG